MFDSWFKEGHVKPYLLLELTELLIFLVVYFEGFKETEGFTAVIVFYSTV